MSGLSLRPATADDVPRLIELVRAAYAHYVPRLGGPPRPMTDDYAEVVRTHQVAVAERRGKILGLVVLGVSDEGFFVDNVAVDPGHQGIGAGRALLERAESAARDAGFDSIYLYYPPPPSNPGRFSLAVQPGAPSSRSASSTIRPSGPRT
jgi:N-acetylglutamate synthase-like GNAT family acetyltransferase